MRLVTVSYDQIAETLEHLQLAGRRGVECVVLWLAEDRGDILMVKQVLCPEQLASEDFFRIPSSSIRALLMTLRDCNQMIAAQVHSHPSLAFHSSADDRWAIVRHEGALSLVVPNFGLTTTAATFADDTKVFQLDKESRWTEVFEEGFDACLQLS